MASELAREATLKTFIIGTRALALVRGRAYVTPEDVKELAPSVLRHRLVLTYEAEAEGATVEEITERILLAVEVP